MYIKTFIASILFCIILLPVTVLGSEVDNFGYLYCGTADIEEVQTTFITTAPLNLRPTPSTDGERIALVSTGSRVEVTDFRDGVWFAVEHNGMTGYMYAEFLRELPTPPAASAASINTAHISGQAEMLEWSVVRDILPKNTPITVIDVRSGLTYQITSFSHGNHADVVPATADDTAIMREAFGGRWCWEPRPIIVFIGDRVIAASINGMPHGGTPNPSNGMNGHICMHFVGSRTHNGNRSHERNHQNAIQEAYNAASNW